MQEGENRWRRGAELNRRIKVLQTSALPLGYRAQSDNSYSECIASRLFKSNLEA